MKILKLLSDFLNTDKIYPSVRKNLEEARSKENNDERFFKCFIGYIGGRGYNEFLDYELYALKLKNIFDNETEFDDDGDICVQMTERLLHDDRHDLYQNLPYILDRAANPNKWTLALDALIDSINVEGTGDIVYKTKLLGKNDGTN